MLSAKHHIDNEAFGEGRDLITQGVATVKASMQRGSYISARVTLGALCHTLQVQRDNTSLLTLLFFMYLFNFKMCLHFI